MMEKRNLIEEKRTPDLDKQQEMDDMDKQASAMFVNNEKRSEPESEKEE